MFGNANPAQYLSMTADGLVKKATGLTTTTGILCATSSTAIIQVWDTPTDETDAKAVKVVGNITLAAGTPYPIPAKFNYGIFVELISGSGEWTIFFD